MGKATLPVPAAECCGLGHSFRPSYCCSLTKAMPELLSVLFLSTTKEDQGSSWLKESAKQKQSSYCNNHGHRNLIFADCRENGWEKALHCLRKLAHNCVIASNGIHSCSCYLEVFLEKLKLICTLPSRKLYEVPRGIIYWKVLLFELFSLT